jgi:hypothetical protein
MHVLYISPSLCSLLWTTKDPVQILELSSEQWHPLYLFFRLCLDKHKVAKYKASFFAHLVMGHDQASRRSGSYYEFQVLAIFSVIDSTIGMHDRARGAPGLGQDNRG